MALKDMSLTPEEAKAQYGMGAVAAGGDADDDAPKYPWGLDICMSDETLSKLGIGLMPVGTEIMIMAKATVVGTSSRQTQSGGAHQDMDVQITAMDIQPAQGPDVMTRAASSIYGSNG